MVPQAHQLLTGAFPFVDRISPNRPDMARVLRAILRDSVDFSHRHWRGISGDAKHFVAVLLAKDAASRPTAKQVLATRGGIILAKSHLGYRRCAHYDRRASEASWKRMASKGLAQMLLRQLHCLPKNYRACSCLHAYTSLRG